MQKTHWLALAVLAAAGVALTAGGEPKQHDAARENPTENTAARDEPAGELPPGHGFGVGQKLPPGHPPIDAGTPAASTAQANDSAQIEGTVAEVLAVERYSYVRLTTPQGDVWAAVPRAEIAVGRRIRVLGALPMRDFQSPSLKRTFALVYFGTIGEVAAQ